MREERAPEGPRQRKRLRGVVPVLVGDEDRLDAVDRLTRRGDQPRETARGETRVQEYPGLLRDDECAVAGATAARQATKQSAAAADKSRAALSKTMPGKHTAAEDLQDF